MKINSIELWTMRCLLVIGAIVCACFSKEEAAGTCVIGLIASFVFLED